MRLLSFNRIVAFMPEWIATVGYIRSLRSLFPPSAARTSAQTAIGTMIAPPLTGAVVGEAQVERGRLGLERGHELRFGVQI